MGSVITTIVTSRSSTALRNSSNASGGVFAAWLIYIKKPLPLQAEFEKQVVVVFLSGGARHGGYRPIVAGGKNIPDPPLRKGTLP